MNYPKNLKFTRSHEWVQTLENGKMRVGISDFAQEKMGDLVFVNLPEPGDKVTAGEAFADMESVKAAADIISPVSGTVAAVNQELLDKPEKINEACYDAWLIEVENAVQAEDLMDAEAYEAFCSEQK